MSGYDDPNHRGNGPQYHTGKPCIVPGCASPAGTAWSKLWCFAHNVERIDQLSAQIQRLIEHAPINPPKAAEEDK